MVDSLLQHAKNLDLDQEWVWYGHQPCGSNTYSKSYIELGRFKTVAEFWQHYNFFPPIGCIHDGTVYCNSMPIVAYSLFRSDIKPEWEHPVNSHGSEWGCRESLDRSTFEILWETYVLGAIGEQIPHCVGIRAINKTNRSRSLHKFEIWLDKVDHISVHDSRQTLLSLVDTPPKFIFIPHQIKQSQAVEYQRHRRRKQSNSTNALTQITVSDNEDNTS